MLPPQNLSVKFIFSMFYCIFFKPGCTLHHVTDLSVSFSKSKRRKKDEIIKSKTTPDNHILIFIVSATRPFLSSSLWCITPANPSYHINPSSLPPSAHPVTHVWRACVVPLTNPRPSFFPHLPLMDVGLLFFLRSAVNQTCLFYVYSPY